jgi:mannose-6-phosphate isomerase-like protein (cupin superfamily)
MINTQALPARDRCDLLGLFPKADSWWWPGQINFINLATSKIDKFTEHGNYFVKIVEGEVRLTTELYEMAGVKSPVFNSTHVVFPGGIRQINSPFALQGLRDTKLILFRQESDGPAPNFWFTEDRFSPRTVPVGKIKSSITRLAGPGQDFCCQEIFMPERTNVAPAQHLGCATILYVVKGEAWCESYDPHEYPKRVAREVAAGQVVFAPPGVEIALQSKNDPLHCELIQYVPYPPAMVGLS